MAGIVVTAAVGPFEASLVSAAAGKHSAPALATASKPSGYTVWESAEIAAPAGYQTYGSVSCPLTKRGVQTMPTGGGLIIDSSDLAANINSSYPAGMYWAGDVDNTSSTDTKFVVYAVCALPTSGYTQVQGTSVNNPAGHQTRGTATCPTGTNILGGGVYSSSPSTAVNINSTFPDGNGWAVDMNNSSGSDALSTVYGVCSKYPAWTGYQVLVGAKTDNPAGLQSPASAFCPTGTVPLGGGELSGSGSNAVNLNSTFPSAGEFNSWGSYENNATNADTTIEPWVICAH